MRTTVRWTDTEVEAVAAETVSLRLSHPFETILELVNKAIHKALPEDRWRNIATFSLERRLPPRIKALWSDLVKASGPVTAPEPLIIQIEVPVPLDYTKLLSQLDGPTIAALAVAKMEQTFARMNVARVEQPREVAPTQRCVSILEAASPKPKRPRVAVLTISGQHEDIKAKVNGLNEKLDIRLIDSEKSCSGLNSCDYAIVTSTCGHDVTTRARSNLPANRVFFTEGITRTVQKLYDIASLPL